MKNKKTVVITIVSIILSLAIGFGCGFLVGKNHPDYLSKKSSNSFSNKDFDFSIDDIKVLSFDTDSIDDYKDQIGFYYKKEDASSKIVVIKCNITNKSNKVINGNSLFKLQFFADGNLCTKYEDYYIQCLILSQYPLFSNKEIQVGCTVEHIYYCMIDDANANQLDINLTSSNDEVYSVFSFNIDEIRTERISFYYEEADKKLKYVVDEGKDND